MIPPFNASSVLPPFIGDAPGLRATMSPFRTDILTFVRRFATTGPRAALLAGLLDYRAALGRAGVASGFSGSMAVSSNTSKSFADDRPQTSTW